MRGIRGFSGFGQDALPNLQLPTDYTPATQTELIAVNEKVDSTRTIALAGAALGAAALLFSFLKK